jgi:hypothetical protein
LKTLPTVASKTQLGLEIIGYELSELANGQQEKGFQPL